MLALAQARLTKQTPKLRVVVCLEGYGDGVHRADQRVALTCLPGVERCISLASPSLVVAD